MARPPARPHPAQVGGDGEEPARERRAWAVAFASGIHFDESLLRDLTGIRHIAGVAQREGHQWFFPPAHQVVQGKVVPILETFHAV